MMKSAKTAATPEIENRTPVELPTTPADSPAENTSRPSAQAGSEANNGEKKDSGSGLQAAISGKLVVKGNAATGDQHTLVDKLLIEGLTFEDVVASVKECGAGEIPLNAVKSYFQGNKEIQAQRVRYMVETSEALFKGLGNPDSAEARLAKAAMATGFKNLYRDVEQVSPKDAEHSRMERANLSLKHKLVVAQRDKARQALRYNEEKIRTLVLTQQKLKEHIVALQQDAKRQQAGEPLGPEMLQRIQQIYGLTCQIPDRGRGDAAKA